MWLIEGTAGLWTDFYELTMAQVYFKQHMQATACFEVTVRHLPPDWGFFVMAGLSEVESYRRTFRFDQQDVAYLRSLGRFDEDFLVVSVHGDGRRAGTVPAGGYRLLCRRAAAGGARSALSCTTAGILPSEHPRLLHHRSDAGGSHDTGGEGHSRRRVRPAPLPGSRSLAASRARGPDGRFRGDEQRLRRTGP